MKMMNMLMAFMMTLVTLAISQPANADTLSDLRATCPGCHNVILRPSGWSLSGSPGGRIASERTLNDWLLTIDRMQGTGMVLPATTSRAVAAQFLFDMQYTATPPPPPAPVTLTSVAVAPVNHTINVGESLQYTATGIFSDGTSRSLINGGHPWSSKAPMSIPRASFAAGVVNGILYTAGGNTLSTYTMVEAYDPVTNTWTPKTSMSTPRYQPAVGVANGILYAVGGWNGSTTIATVEAYDPITNTWTPKAPMSIPRHGHAVGVVNGILYAVGGAGPLNGSGYADSPLATVEAYDPATDTWTPRASMSMPRSDLAVGVVNGILYAGGGYSNGSLVATVEAYDPATNTWTPKASMLVPRWMFSMGAVNGTLYAVGGDSTIIGLLAAVEGYDPGTNTWTPKPSMPTPRYGLAVGVVNDTLYAMGGCCSGAGNLATVEAYTPPGEVTWSSTITPIANIGQAGLALGVNAGSTTITATSGSVSGSTSLVVVGGQADLSVSAVSGSVATVERGKNFTFNSTTKNQGTAATATSTSTGLYFSTDATITTADARVGTVSVGILAPAASQSASTIVTVPKTLARGTYYLGAIADYTGAQAESNESNNSFTGTTIEVK